MHRGMTARAPAGPLAQKLGVGDKAYINLAAGSMLDLRMASQTQVRIACDQQFAIHRAVRVMTHRAALPQRLMLENDRAGLFAMTPRAALIEPRHGQAAAGLEYIGAVGIMTLDAIHPTLQHRMMLRQIKFGVGLKMALEAGGSIFSRIHNELASATAGFDVFAARPVARFAAALAGKFRAFNVQPAMRTGREHPCDIGVAIVAGFVARVSRSGNLRRGVNGPRNGRTRVQQ